MITIKIGKKLKVQKYLIKGLKVFLLKDGKWILIKLNKNEVELLDYIIHLTCKNRDNK